ncbi:IS630 family transposase [Streptomyces sp. NPDC048473]|uniref:IS630 family transposase n=1 Tax=unclassified Streptomyces TaxID=2593676 RepID=UPI00371EF415
MAERVRVREIDDDEGRRLLRIIRRGTGSVVTWRRAQMVLLSAQGMPVAKIAEVTFTSDDRVRDVIHNFNTDGFGSLYPKYKGGRPRTFTLPECREIKKIAKSKPAEHSLPFSTWSLTKLTDFLVAEGVVDDISHEGLRILLREEGVSFQRLKTWKTSRDPDYAAKKARVEHLYAIADGEVIPEDGEPEVVFCMDEFGPFNLMPHPGRQWAERGGRHKDPDREPRRRRRATYARPHGVRHLFAALDMAKDKLYGHIKLVKKRTQLLAFCRYLRSLYPPEVRIAIVCDNFSPHLTTKKCQRVGTWVAGRIVPGFVATSQGLIRCDAAVCNRRVDDTPRGLSVCEPAAYRGGVGVSPLFADAATASCACLSPLIAMPSPLRSPSARKRPAPAV